MPRQRSKRAPLRRALVVPIGLAIGAMVSPPTQARAMGEEATPSWWSDGWRGDVDGDAAVDLGFRGPRTAAPPPSLGLSRPRPRRAGVASQPFVLHPGSSGQLLLHGRFDRDRTGRRSSDLGFRYRDRFHDQPVQFGLSGGLRDGSSTDPDQRSLGAEFRTAPLGLRVQLYDDLVDEGGGAGRTADRMVDGYDVEVGARLPLVRFAWLKANRFWKITTDGDDAEPADSFSLRLAPLAPLEIETGSTSIGDERSWFARLRLRFRLGAVP